HDLFQTVADRQCHGTVDCGTTDDQPRWTRRRPSRTADSAGYLGPNLEQRCVFERGTGAGLLIYGEDGFLNHCLLRLRTHSSVQDDTARIKMREWMHGPRSVAPR